MLKGIGRANISMRVVGQISKIGNRVKHVLTKAYENKQTNMSLKKGKLHGRKSTGMERKKKTTSD